MNCWQVVENDTYTGLECNFQPKCHYCEVPQENSCIKLLNFPLNESDFWETGKMNGYAIDVEVECPICGYWETFGVAVDKKHWKIIHAQTEKIIAEEA